MTRMLVAVFGLVLALLVGACGGGEEATPTPQPTAAPQPTATPRPTAAPQPTATPAPTGTLTVAVATFGEQQWEPSLLSSQRAGTVVAPMYDWLIWTDAKGDLAPGAALSWEMSPDGKSWTYTLRSMTFHSGDTLSAEDVKFGIERIIRPQATSSNAGAWRANVESAEVLGPLRVKVNAKKAWTLMNYDASFRSAAEGVVISKSYFDKVGGEDGFRSKPVGTGPWVLEREQIGQRLLYKANPSGHPYRPRSRFQNLEYLVAPELSTRVAMLKTGQADLASISPSSVQDLKQAGNKVLEIPASADHSVFFFRIPPAEAQKFPTSKLEVRKAMALAINRQELLDTVLNGLGSLNARFLSVPGQIGNDPSWKSTPYDPAQAKQLLASAGYANGFDFEFNVAVAPNAPWYDEGSAAVAGYWKAVGIRTKLVTYEYGTYIQLYRKIPKPPELVGRAHLQSAPILANSLPFFNAISVAILEAHPELKDSIGEATAATDPARQIALIREISDKQFESYQFPSLVTTSDLWGASKRIKGWTAGPTEWVGKALQTVELQ